MAKRYVFNLEAAKRQAGARARIMEVSHPQRKLPPCSWCKKRGLNVTLEYVQEGMWWSDFLIIAVCEKCDRATIIVYQSEEEQHE